MKVLVLGAGRMGRAITFDLTRSKEVEEVILADIDIEKAKNAKISQKVRFEHIDVTDSNIVESMKECDLVISAVTYQHNFVLARAAIDARVNLCDLGGNIDIVEKELELNEKAKEAGITIIPDCGLAPGITNILAFHGAKKFDEINEIHLRVGGIPQNPEPPLGYKIFFSVQGLLNEYLGKAKIIRNGKIMEVDPLTEIEEIEIQPFGKLEAFQTSGGTSTLCNTFKGKVKELDYKTIRYPGHCEKFGVMMNLGFADEDPIEVDGEMVKPRDILAALLNAKLADKDAKDVVILRVSISGKKDGKKKKIVYNLIDYFDENNNVSAMMRTTAYPASIIAQMLANGRIKERGALPPELCVPADLFLAELKKRGINITMESERMR